jgi:hypothetical protein
MRRDSNQLDLLRRWAVLLDSVFRVPGTQIRFGFDAIVGLIPGLGDLSAPVFAAFIIGTGFRMGVPHIVLARMVLNAALDVVLGLVPLLGDLVDVAWKANLRNMALLERHARPGVPPAPADYAFVTLCLILLGGLIATPILLLIWLLTAFPLV